METDEIQIRLAAEDENLDGFRSWLPQAFLSLPRPAFFLAERKEDGKIIGLGSLRMLGGKERMTGRFQLYVLPGSRRKGGGGRLMRVMTDHCRGEDGVAMLAGVPVAEGGGGESVFFERIEGFEVKRTLYKFVMKTETAWNYLHPLITRLTKKGGLPETYEIVSLENANQQRVHRFVLEHLGGIPDSLARRLRGGEGGFLPKLSVVVRTVDGPAAVLLVSRNEKGLVVDSRVVAPKHRGTWVNVALMYTFLRNIRPMGVQEVYFEGDDQLHEDTMKLARRGACELLETNHLYGCDLKEASDGGRG